MAWEEAAWRQAGDPRAEVSAKLDLLRWRLHAILAELEGDVGQAYEAVLVRPDLPPGRELLGRLLLEAHKPAEAVPHLRLAQHANPFDVQLAGQLFRALGESNDGLGQRKLADDCRLLRQAAPDLIPAASWIAEVPPPGNDLASIVILACNELECTRLCLESALTTTRAPYELILVDNASTDNTWDYFQEIATRPGPKRVKLIRNEINLGFPAGCNQAIKYARVRYLVFLNNDTVTTPGWLETLIAWSLSDWPRTGMVGPMSNYTAAPQLVAAGYRDLAGLQPFAARRRREFAGKALEVDRLMGFCLLVRREVIREIGSFDERFGLGFFDDDDLSLRVRKAGFKLKVALGVFIHHFGSRTFKSLGLDAGRHLRDNFERFKAKWGEQAGVGYALPAAGNGEGSDGGALKHSDRRTSGFGRDEHGPRTESSPPWNGGAGGVTETSRTRGDENQGWRCWRQWKWAGCRLLPPAPPCQGGGEMHRQGEIQVPFPAGGEIQTPLPRGGENQGRDDGTAGDGPDAGCYPLPPLARGRNTGAFAKGEETGVPTVSLCMIVKNEEANLPACLEAVVGLFSDMVVVDTGSTDGTKAIAARFGAKVIDFQWIDSFCAARNVAIEHAQGDWIFWLDADDRVDADNRERLRHLFQHLRNENVAYSMKCVCLPDPSRDTTTVVDHIRLFRRDPAIRWRYRVHEQILPAIRAQGGNVCFANIQIQHTGYQDPALRARKLDRDVRLLRLELDEHPNDPFAQFNIGSVFQEMGKLPEALACLKRSLEGSHPSDSIVRKLYASITQIHRHLNQTHEAWSACSSGLELYPEDTELLFQQGILFQEKGDLDGAERVFQSLLTTKDGAYFASVDTGLRGFKARHNLALTLTGQQRLAEAEAHWQMIVEEHPGFGPAWWGLGEIAFAQGQWVQVSEIASHLENGARCPQEARELRRRLHAVTGPVDLTTLT